MPSNEPKVRMCVLAAVAASLWDARAFSKVSLGGTTHARFYTDIVYNNDRCTYYKQ